MVTRPPSERVPPDVMVHVIVEGEISLLSMDTGVV